MSAHHINDQYRAVPGALRQSGGLQWHLRALWYRTLHDPFRRSIGGFLQSWRPRASHLIIVGPSAGWFLPQSFLCVFSRLTLVDLDTSAPFFFKLRHGQGLRHSGISWEWVIGDFIECLPRKLDLDPGAAVLFCNVLGQLGLERDDYERQLTELPGWLEGRPWASFHDRFSARITREEFPSTQPFTSLEKMGEDMLRELGFGGEWSDHGTERVLPSGVLRHYFPWSITPYRFHWIEAGVVT